MHTVRMDCKDGGYMHTVRMDCKDGGYMHTVRMVATCTLSWNSHACNRHVMQTRSTQPLLL